MTTTSGKCLRCGGMGQNCVCYISTKDDKKMNKENTDYCIHCRRLSGHLDSCWYVKELKWYKFYLDMAEEFAKMSKDPRLKVGAVIVTNDGILYPGYNGWEMGGTNEPDSLEPGQSGAVHAEANAILKFNPTIHKNSKMYLTHSPCPICARMIVNTQAISEVYYGQEYRDSKGISILRERGIRCEKI